ncbi:MAG: hypothetical protein WCE33_13015, partial [Nitrososphaeraceae archaeon]
PGYAPSGAYLKTPSLHIATTSVVSAVEYEDNTGAVWATFESRDIDRPTARPIAKEMTVTTYLFVDLISFFPFFLCISGSKAIMYKMEKSQI